MAQVAVFNGVPGQQHAALAAQAPAVAPGVPSVTAPEIVEDRRIDHFGNPVVRRYVKGRLLGKGGFAKCFKFSNLEKNKTVAGKVVDKASLAKSRAKQKLLAEIKIHRSLNHHRIVGFDTYFEDRTNVYIMLELCPYQTLMELVKRRKRLQEWEAGYWSLQLLDSMRYLHSHGIIHRDLKLGNLFIGTDMAIRVGDFGLATQLTHPDERKRTICGTPNYIAPEILDGSGGLGHSYEVDTWAFGVILYTLLVGKPPFETTDVKATYKRIRDVSYSFPEEVPISAAAVDLISRILVLRPTDRPSLEVIARHPFFTGPGVALPTSLPVSALTDPPRLEDAEPGCVVSGETAVLRMLAAPLGSLLPGHQLANYAQPTARQPLQPARHGAGNLQFGGPSAGGVGGGKPALEPIQEPSAGTPASSLGATSLSTATTGSTASSAASWAVPPQPGVPGRQAGAVGTGAGATSAGPAPGGASRGGTRAAAAAAADVEDKENSPAAAVGRAGAATGKAAAVAAAASATAGLRSRGAAREPLSSMASQQHQFQPSGVTVLGPIHCGGAPASRGYEEGSRSPPLPPPPPAAAVHTRAGAHHAPPATRQQQAAAGPGSSSAVGAFAGRAARRIGSPSSPASPPPHGYGQQHHHLPHASRQAAAGGHEAGVGAAFASAAAPSPRRTALGPSFSRAGNGFSSAPGAGLVAPLPPSSSGRAAEQQHGFPLSSGHHAAGVGSSSGGRREDRGAAAMTMSYSPPAPPPPPPAAAAHHQQPSATSGSTLNDTYRVIADALDAASARAVAAPSLSHRTHGAAANRGGHLREDPGDEERYLREERQVTEALRSVSLGGPGGAEAGGRAAAARAAIGSPMAVEEELGHQGSAGRRSRSSAWRGGVAAALLGEECLPWAGALPLCSPSARASPASRSAAPFAPLWVTTWIDFTAKYGLGYLLSNGSVGVYFNDSTKIVLAPGVGEAFQYTERSPPGTAPGVPAPAPRRLTGSLSDFQPELKKKVTLLKHFRGYLQEQYAKRLGSTRAGEAAVFGPLPVNGATGSPAAGGSGGGSPGARAAAAAAAAQVGVLGPLLPVTRAEEGSMAAAATAGPPSPSASPSPLVFVKKFVRTRRTLVFRLSNSTMQLFFHDGTTMLLGDHGAHLTVLDRRGARHVWDVPALLHLAAHPAEVPLGYAPAEAAAAAAAAEAVGDLAQRLRYSRDVLSQMALGTAQALAGAAAAAPASGGPR